MMASHGDGGFADLPVADDELALAAPNRHHRIDALDAHLHGLIDGLPGDYAGRDLFHGRRERSVDGALAVDGVAERVHHAAEQFTPYRHFQDALGAACGHAFGEALVVAEHYAAYGVTFQVQRQANQAAGELDHLAVLRLGEAVDAHDAGPRRKTTVPSLAACDATSRFSMRPRMMSLISAGFSCCMCFLLTWCAQPAVRRAGALR